MAVFPTNAIIKTAIALPNGRLDGYGNPSVSSCNIQIEAYLKSGSGASRDRLNNELGLSLGQQPLQGRVNRVLIDGIEQPAAALPPTIQPGQTGDITVNDVGGDRRGTFAFHPQLGSAFTVVDETLGGPISGIFTERAIAGRNVLA